jgi:hypothetical protein
MFRELHHKLGENGQALTVLSLLSEPAKAPRQTQVPEETFSLWP